MTTTFAVAPLLVAASVAAADAAPAHAGHHATHHPRPTVAGQVRHEVDRTGSASVVVLLRSHAATAKPDTRRGAAAHRAAVAAAQRPVLDLLRGHGAASRVHAYSTFGVIAANVTKAGLAKLEASGDVALIAPNALIHEAPLTSATGAGSSTTSSTAAKPSATKPPTPVVGPAVTPPDHVCSSTPQLTPEALQTTDTQSTDPNAKTARSLGYTGAGVTVAFMAEGIDVNNPDFIRADGSPVFTDYQDFSGDGTTAPTSGGEAFLDASSIAAQGREVYNVSNYTYRPDKGACRIRIEGVAPGANLVAIKVFSNGVSTTSGFLQGIDYAVNTDHVNVLNESFGYNPIPDTTLDVIKQADEAAVRAGTTVTVSSGDAGVTSTIGSPATDQTSGIISAGASTTFRGYLQSGLGGSRFPGVKGYVSDNISSLSSAGTDETGGTVDMVAPGDLNWDLCTPDPEQYSDCTDYRGNAAAYGLSGGTSEAAPLVAGGAALVIQAYRQTHDGDSPTPAQVSQLLISTARDIQAPGDQQGAGELDTYRAVLAAASLPGNSITPAPQGDTFVTDTAQIDAAGNPGTAVSKTVSITNTGASSQTIRASTRAITSWSSFHQTKLTLSKSSPTYITQSGLKDPYARVTFTVPRGVSRLNAAIAYPGASSSLDARAAITLIDPRGRLAGYSLPQGVGNYGDTQVADPVAGKWTAYVFTRPAAAGGSLGHYVFGWQTGDYTRFGSVSPSSLTLAPGASGTVTYTGSTPASPGDQAGSLVLNSSTGGGTTIPVVTRSYIPLSTSGTPFHGTLTGGNGRQADSGQTAYYQVVVPSGTAQLNATVSLADNPVNPFFISLIDPNGDQVAYGSNLFQTSPTATPSPQLSGTAHTLNPTAGTWDVVVNFAPFVSGTALSERYGVLVNSLPSTASAVLPGSATAELPAGVAYRGSSVTIKNDTTAPEAFFLDPRTSGSTTMTLAGTNTTLTLPFTTGPTWLVPSDVTSTSAEATASAPVEFDWGPEAGDPDLESDSPGTTSTGSYTGAPDVTSGVWYANPDQLGPYGSVPSKHATATMTMQATGQGFDTAVTSPTNDLWLQSVDAKAAAVKPVVVAPGKTVTIPVTITPNAASGTTVSGTIYVDQLAAYSNYGALPNANQVAALPYSYTVR